MARHVDKDFTIRLKTAKERYHSFFFLLSFFIVLSNDVVFMLDAVPGQE